MLKGKKILLRKLKDSDLDFLLNLENNEDDPAISGSSGKIPKSTLKRYIQDSHKDIFIEGQCRFLIEHKSMSIGCIDLFGFNIDEMSFDIGLIISNKYRNKGYAKDALNCIINYAYNDLHIERLYSSIFNDNQASINLFTNAGFVFKESISDNNTNKYILER